MKLTSAKQAFSIDGHRAEKASKMGWKESLRILFLTLFVTPTNQYWIQFFRYAFVGGVAFLADFTFLFILTEYGGIPYLISASISFIVGLTVNYVLSTHWIFLESKTQKKWLEFLIFALVGCVGLGLTLLFMWTFTTVLGIFYLLSKIITTILVYFWNFSARKFLLF